MSRPSSDARRMAGLLGSVRRCTLCAGLPLGAKPILQASAGARILIAGQAPGRRAHDRGVAFDDPSGDRLRRWLGVDKGTFYDPKNFAILPMGFCYPGTGASGDLPPRAECAPQWRERVLDLMPRLEFTLVIGQYAQSWHLATGASLTEAVADWRRYWPDLLPLPHPSPRNQRWMKRNPWFETEVLPALAKRVRGVLERRS